MALDPVCGMTVDPARAAGHVEHDGTTYYFCSKGCVAKFTADPKKYLSGVREPMTASPRPRSCRSAACKKRPLNPQSSIPNPQSQEWICPMDPEVLSDRPGACPVCGMALEPRVPDLSDAPNPELVDMTRRFRIGVALGAPVFVAGDGGHGERRPAVARARGGAG